ncbi:hypothetical protein BJY01DRAFT_84897 [Aspergillus pseudoustus]|uniref:BZIP domain-containing protein n=1 Tax=Aspergillus pseudoustus TaxID=1810923 RepID=A0ABR4J256_9EURO
MAATPELDEVIAERKERKRTQNRLNQRARRLRLQQAKSERSRCKGRPYRVDRWRLEELAGPVSDTIRLDRTIPPEEEEEEERESVAVVSIQSYTATPVQNSDTDKAASTSASYCGPSFHPDDPPPPPALPADHLLTLIQLNAWRGLRQNKETLWGSTLYYMPSTGTTSTTKSASSLEVSSTLSPSTISLPTTIHPDTLFYGSSLITRVRSTARLPETLVPTEPQMSLIHATWINNLPFPHMRENLIRFEAQFSHAEFVQDLVGDLVDTGRFFGGPTSSANPNSNFTSNSARALDVADAEDDAMTASRSGLIIWGEPYRVESWEATPGFLRKWMWALEGCEELIQATNRWRAVRGEEPVRY